MSETNNNSTGSAPIRVLVLDDEESIRRVVQNGLSRLGCVVKTAANGRQGLQMLLTDMFDVTVVDLRMHEMDGIAFIQEARKIWPWQRFVIYSGFIDEHFSQLAKEEGIETILSKPLDMNILMEAVTGEVNRNDGGDKPVNNPQLPRKLISHQLNIMRHISTDVLHSQNLLNGLIQLGRAINDMLPYHVMGILTTDDEKLLLLQSKAPQPESAFSHIQQYIIERYQALSGQLLKAKDLRIERSGPAASGRTGREIKSITSVPVIAGDKVEGILTLGSFEADAFDDVNVALLYQAASSLSTLSTALHEMRQMATRDPLTGLYNRRQLDEELERAWRLSLRYNHPMAVLMIDMDGLKDINDQWGHKTGDDVIRAFAEMLKGATRSTDLLARYGGDEFIILLPQAGRSEASTLGDRVLSTIRSSRVESNEIELPVSASIGIATFEPGDKINGPEELIHHADQALYRAKNGGRNQYIFWTDTNDEDTGSENDDGDDYIPKKGKVLVLDDEQYVVTLMERILKKEGYEVVPARTISEAIAELKVRGRSFDIILCDLKLPDGDGMEVLRWARETDYDIVGIIITGNVTADNAINALRHGVYDFIQKPISTDSLVALLNRALQYRKLLRENARYRAYLEEMVRSKKSELSKALDDIKVSYEFTLEAMVAMLDAREFDTGQHSVRVRELTHILASKMGVNGEQLEEICRGALLHDIGKIGIPDAILLKPGKLTDDEWDVMRRHPEIGFRFLKNSDFLQTAAGVVLSHHERWDGKGYPNRLKGEDINIGARIFAVIDAYDAMRSSRVYKDSTGAEEALAEIKRESGKQFDPDVVNAFLSCLPEIEKTGRWEQSFS